MLLGRGRGPNTNEGARRMRSRWCKPRCRRWRAPGERRCACCAGSVVLQQAGSPEIYTMSNEATSLAPHEQPRGAPGGMCFQPGAR